MITDAQRPAFVQAATHILYHTWELGQLDDAVDSLTKNWVEGDHTDLVGTQELETVDDEGEEGNPIPIEEQAEAEVEQEEVSLQRHKKVKVTTPPPPKPPTKASTAKTPPPATKPTPVKPPQKTPPAKKPPVKTPVKK